jgi:hypothetical protein
VSGINIDKTPPTVTFAASSPAPNTAGWNNTNVSIAFTTTDNLSGVASAAPAGPLVLTTEGSTVTGSVTASDLAGNSATVTSPPVKIDKTPPVITITAPANGATYLLNQVVAASYVCSDAGSGVATCSGPVASGSNFTSEVGTNKLFTVTATDVAGNVAAPKTNNYSVGYNYTFTPPKSPANLGSAVPLIWQLKDANGIVSDLASLVLLQSVSNGSVPASGGCVANPTGTSQILFSAPNGSTGNSSFRFVPPNFQFNWDSTTAISTGKGCYTILITLKDGSAPKMMKVQLK